MNIKIDYIENGIKENGKTTLLVCPGLSESAKDYLKLITRLDDRRCVALSFRGRGKSDSPTKGYRLEDHIKDINEVVNKLKIKDFCIMGYSRGVSYTLGYSILNPGMLKGLIIGEYPPEHKKMPKGWASESMEFYRTHCDFISINYDVLKAIENESVQVNFREKLGQITCPALILKGEQKESLLSNEDISTYTKYLNSRSIRIEKFDKAGHDIQSDDFDSFTKIIGEFLLTLDN